MKKIFIIAILSLMSVTSIAQERELSEDCKKYLSLMQTYGAQEMWRDAADFFKKAHEVCGEKKFNKGDWERARIIYGGMLAVDTSAKRQIEIRDTIYWCYESEMKLFKTADLSAEYAAELVKNQSKEVEKIDGLFSESIHELRERLSINEMIYYFYHLIGKYNKAKGDTKEDVRNFAIEEYLKLSDYITIAKKVYKERKNDKAVDGYKRAQGYLDNYFTKLAKDCEMLTSVLSKKTADLPKEKEAKLAKIQGFLSILEKRGCDKSDLYGQLADSLITISPSAHAYYSQGNFFKNKKQNKKAQTYFEKAVEMETETGENIDKYNLAMADVLLKNKNYKAAFRAAKKVNGEFKGLAMKICASAIGSTANSCGETTFERKSNNWLADDYMKKASALGESYSSSYKNRAPSSEESFDAGKKTGDAIRLKCWGESTTVR